MRAANAFEARTFIIWPAKRNDLERAVHYLAARSNNKSSLYFTIENDVDEVYLKPAKVDFIFFVSHF